jgi:hypothetical protein
LTVYCQPRERERERETEKMSESERKRIPVRSVVATGGHWPELRERELERES